MRPYDLLRPWVRGSQFPVRAGGECRSGALVRMAVAAT